MSLLQSCKKIFRRNAKKKIYQKLPIYVTVIIGDLPYFFYFPNFLLCDYINFDLEKILIFKKLICVGRLGSLVD